MNTFGGVPIVNGLRVFTNNLDRGVVANVGKQKHDPEWFDVILDMDYRGRPITGVTMQNAERVSTTFDGKKA